MKKLRILSALLALALLTSNVIAQNATQLSDEIILTEENGVKTLKITTTINGKPKTETFNNADAEKKLAELEKTGKVSKTVIIAPDGSAYTKIEVTKNK